MLRQATMPYSGPNALDRPPQADLNNQIRRTIEEALQGFQVALTDK